MDRLPLPPRTNQPTVLRGGYHMVKVGREWGGVFLNYSNIQLISGVKFLIFMENYG